MHKKFEDVLDKLLKEKWSDTVIKKVHSQEKKIKGTKNIPHYNLEDVARRKLEKVFATQVHSKFAREVLTALEYAESHSHYRTGATLLEDIVTHQRIVFNNYR